MDEDGVSPVIGTVMVLSILTLVTSTMLTVVWPQIQDNQQSGEFQVVSSQFSRLGADANQMALGGNLGEVRQRTIAMADGQLGLEHGHLWSISTGILDENYSQVAGDSVTAGEHPGFKVVEGAKPMHSSFQIQYLDERAQTADSLSWALDRFTGSSWEDSGDDSGSVAYEGTFTVSLPTGHTLRDGPWRVQVSDDDGDLIGEVYIYELDRLTYLLQGSLHSREAMLENGALFSREDASMYAHSPGLYRTAASGGGTGGLNLRAAHFDASTMTEVSGRSKTTVHMTLTAHEHLAHDQGAIHVRLQPLSGPHTTAWASHLTGGDFDPETDAEGVVFTWQGEEEDEVETFPLSVVYSELKVRMVGG